MLFAPVAFALGAGAYLSLPFEPPIWTPPALVAACAPPLAISRRFGLTALGLLALVCASSGAMAAQVKARLVAAPVLGGELGPVWVEGVVAAIDSGARSRRVLLRVHAIEGLATSRTPAFVRVAHRSDIAFGPGRAVACRAVLSPPPQPVVPGDYPFHKDAWFRRLGAVGFTIGACSPISLAPETHPLEAASRRIDAMRRDIARHVVSAAPGSGGAIAAALIVGDRSYISAEDSEALQASGLAHLLSISGVHMVLIGGAVYALVRWTWPLWPMLALRIPVVRAAACSALIACSLYFLISGAEVATQRAYIMAMVGFGAKALDQPALSMRSLATAMAIVLILQPEAVTTPGFQMSFAASAALIALFEVWRGRAAEGAGVIARTMAWIIGLAATSFIASSATAPFALHHFERAAPLSVPANMLTSPIIAFWTTPSALAAAIAAPFGQADVFLRWMAASLDVVISVARWAGEVGPVLPLPALGAGAMVLSAVSIGFACGFTGWMRLAAIAPGLLAGVLWWEGGRPALLIATDGEVFLHTGEA